MIAELEAVKEARKLYVTEDGESQQAIKDKNKVLDELDECMDDFKDTAFIALEERPQLLEVLGYFHKELKTTGKRSPRHRGQRHIPISYIRNFEKSTKPPNPFVCYRLLFGSAVTGHAQITPFRCDFAAINSESGSDKVYSQTASGNAGFAKYFFIINLIFIPFK